MSLRYYYRNEDGDIVEFTDRVQRGWADNPADEGLTQNAEEGSIGISTVRVEDPDGDWQIDGHRLVLVQETECIGDDYNGYIYSGYSQEQTIERDLMRTGAARIWTIGLVDLNTVFDRRIMEGSDSKRPAETDVERIQWAEATNEGSLIDDTLYLSTDAPVQMDAADYRGQSFKNIFNDCAQQSGKNWYLWRHLSEWSLWYGPRGTTDFVSDIKISNVLSDQDGVTVFAPALDSKLVRDPSRVYSGVHLAYANSFVYKQREATAAQFARRDAYTPAPNVKTKTKAVARANRELTDMSTQELVIDTAILVPRAQTNDVIAGQRIQVKFAHFPAFEDYVWCRVLTRTVRDTSPDLAEIALRVSPDEPVDVPSGNVFGTLGKAHGFDRWQYVWFDYVGDAPTAGCGTQPTVGLIEPLSDDSSPLAPTWTYYGWKINGTGTINVSFYTSTIGIGLVGVIQQIRKNGIPVAEINYDATGFNGSQLTVTATDLEVEPDDVITTYLECDPPNTPFFRAPRGTGDCLEALTITGGNLV